MNLGIFSVLMTQKPVWYSSVVKKGLLYEKGELKRAQGSREHSGLRHGFLYGTNYCMGIKKWNLFHRKAYFQCLSTKIEFKFNTCKRHDVVSGNWTYIPHIIQQSPDGPTDHFKLSPHSPHWPNILHFMEFLEKLAKYRVGFTGQRVPLYA